MPSGFLPRAFENAPTSFPAYGVIVSPTGKFVMVAGANPGSLRCYMWDPIGQIYRDIPPPPPSPNNGVWSDDETLFIDVQATANGFPFVYSVDPSTGAFTQIAVGAQNFGRVVVFLPPNKLVFCGTGANRYVNVCTFAAGAVTLATSTANNFAPTSASVAVPSPVANCFYRVAVNGTVQLYEVDPTTNVVTLKASITNNFAIGNIAAVALNHDRTILAMSCAGSAAAAAPWVRLVKYDIGTNTFSAIPTGAATTDNYPRPGLEPANKLTPVFMSEDGALYLYPNDSGGVEQMVQMTGSGATFVAVDPAIIPSGIGYSGSLSQPFRNAHSSNNNKVTAFASSVAPYIHIFQQSSPSGDLFADGIMGLADVELKVNINASFDALGLMGSAAVSAEVNINATITEMGFLGTASMVGGTDPGGVDIKFVFLQDYYILLDSGPVEYEVTYLGPAALLDATGIMGFADILFAQGEYGELEAVGIMGRADLSLNYDTAQAEIAARGLMGSAAINADAQEYTEILAVGPMGRATIVINSPIPAYFAAQGIMGTADLILMPPTEGSIDAIGIMGDAEIFAFDDYAMLVDAFGLMGDAEIILDLNTIDIDAMGLMGDAEILTFRSKEYGQIAALGIMGVADIRTMLVVPLDATLDAVGLMGRAEIFATMPDTAFLTIDALGIMGQAEVLTLNDEFVRLGAVGIMGQAEFYIADGWRGDIRAVGLMGRAEMIAEVTLQAFIDAQGIMGRADMEMRRNRRSKRFFIIKPF